MSVVDLAVVCADSFPAEARAKMLAAWGGGGESVRSALQTCESRTGGAVLSLFPGVGLLDRAFEAEGFCVVRGPDLLWGGDVRKFAPAAGSFWGVIGGPPCQDFSAARRAPATGNGRKMLAEFARVVGMARPAWWLLENVPRCPDVKIEGYGWQRIDVNEGWYSSVSRLRHFQFGAASGVQIDVPRGGVVRGAEPAALARDGRTFRELCRLQGLAEDFDLPGLTLEAKKAAVGNGVPQAMGRTLARAVRRAYGLAVAGEEPAAVEAERRRCECGCGRVIRREFARYDGPACRKRAERARTKAQRHEDTFGAHVALGYLTRWSAS